MGVLAAILVICLLVVGFSMHLGGTLLQVIALFLLVLVGFTMVSRLFRRWFVDSDDERPRSGRLDLDRRCPNRRCGKVNELHARFCAQCGTPLSGHPSES